MNCPYCQEDLPANHGTGAAIAQILDDIGRLLALAYSQRACFICGKLGACKHRQPEVELAIMAPQLRAR